MIDIIVGLAIMFLFPDKDESNTRGIDKREGIHAIIISEFGDRDCSKNYEESGAEEIEFEDF